MASHSWNRIVERGHSLSIVCIIYSSLRSLGCNKLNYTPAVDYSTKICYLMSFEAKYEHVFKFNLPTLLKSRHLGGVDWFIKAINVIVPLVNNFYADSFHLELSCNP